jgi:energy-converting hydrogenase Eha subunit H
MRSKVIYAAVVVFVTLVAVGVGNVLYTNHVDQRRVESARVAAEAQRRQAEQTLAAVCALVLANVQVYDETPATTAAGKNAEAAWDTLKTQFSC